MSMPNYTMPLYRPPSEARSLIFQITEGCSWNRCTFCAMYDTKSFRLKKVDAVLNEIAAIDASTARRVDKVFLADGDAAIYPTEGLLSILDALSEKFPGLERVSAYTGPQALIAKGAEEWAALAARKLNLLYFGLESGDDTVLGWMNKGMTAGEMTMPVARAMDAGVDFSVMAILGAGGTERMTEHALSTAAWISTVNPAYFSLLTLFVRKDKADYLEHITVPTVGGLLDEAETIVTNITGSGIVFRSNHVSNMVRMAGVLSEERAVVLAQIDRAKNIARQHGLIDTLPELYREGI